MVRWRWDIDMFPELGFQEICTVALVAPVLEECYLPIGAAIPAEGALRLLHQGASADDGLQEQQ